jgi:hypothetical protein
MKYEYIKNQITISTGILLSAKQKYMYTTIKYEIGPLLKDGMAQPNKGGLTYAMPFIYTNREHTTHDRT